MFPNTSKIGTNRYMFKSYGCFVTTIILNNRSNFSKIDSAVEVHIKGLEFLLWLFTKRSIFSASCLVLRNDPLLVEIDLLNGHVHSMETDPKPQQGICPMVCLRTPWQTARIPFSVVWLMVATILCLLPNIILQIVEYYK